VLIVNNGSFTSGLYEPAAEDATVGNECAFIKGGSFGLASSTQQNCGLHILWLIATVLGRGIASMCEPVHGSVGTRLICMVQAVCIKGAGAAHS
jgi:hypothetical protein